VVLLVKLAVLEAGRTGFNRNILGLTSAGLLPPRASIGFKSLTCRRWTSHFCQGFVPFDLTFGALVDGFLTARTYDFACQAQTVSAWTAAIVLSAGRNGWNWRRPAKL
jgi:hypothetical protein